MVMKVGSVWPELQHGRRFNQGSSVGISTLDPGWLKLSWSVSIGVFFRQGSSSSSFFFALTSSSSPDLHRPSNHLCDLGERMLLFASIASCGFRRAAAAPTLSCRLTPSHTCTASRMSRRFKSTLRVIPASSSAEREVPTPILFLTASKWTSSAPASEAFAEWIEHFSSQGYSSLLLDLDPDQPTSDVKDSAQLMEIFEKDTIKTLHQAGQTPPFPPVMISSGPASLIAQTYVSSRPLTALQLIDPPINNKYLRKDRPELLPSDLAEFDFEITFPVRVVWSQAELQRQQEKSVPWYDVHRIEHEREEEADESLERYTFVTVAEGAKETQEWLEGELGV